MTHQDDTESPQPVAEAESLVGTVLFAFFRDKDCAANLKDDRDYYAAGIITGRWATNSVSGKDLSVTYLDPFTGYVESRWRADGEIEIYPVDEWEWKALKERYNAIEANSDYSDQNSR